MRAIISSTYDSTYSFFIPITTWLWNKLGVDVVCFMPEHRHLIFKGFTEEEIDERKKRYYYLSEFLEEKKLNCHIYRFFAPEHKEATYAQCSRLFAHTVTIPEDGALIVSDVDMLVFKVPPIHHSEFTIWGADLVPEKQYPMCFITGTHERWETTFDKYGNTLQECLDNLLGGIECDNMRGNYWGKDQETAYNEISQTNPILFNRAREGTQFASHRIDRDDAYFMDRLTPDIVDYHMHRPGFTEDNIEKIISVISYFYPTDDLNWIREYAAEYRKLL